MVAISSYYNGLKQFFVDILRIEQPSLDMFVRDLVKKASIPSPPIDVIKDLIGDISTLRPPPESLEQLREVSFVPVRQSSGEKQLFPPKSLFTIENNAELANIFSGQAPTLDFNLVQVHKIRPFIKAMGWDQRLMSECIVEASEPGQAMLAPGMSMFFRHRAFALLT